MPLPSPEQLAKSGTEHGHQVAFFAEARRLEAKYPCLDLLHAIPNGGSRGDTEKSRAIEGGKMKAEGVRKGIPDIHLPVARRGYLSLYIELKKIGKRNETSDDQERVIGRLREEGHFVGVCEGWEEARDCLLWYLNI